MHLTKLFLVPFLIACVELASRGGSGGSSSTPPPTLGSVNGNWHLAGAAGTSGSEQLPTLNLAIGVNGNSIYGFGDMAVEQNCANVTSVFENTTLILSGSVSSSGAFVLTNPIAYDVGVQAKGQIPLAGSTHWTGSYTMAKSSQYDCTVSSSNTFSATAIQSLTGTLTGTVVGVGVGIGFCDFSFQSTAQVAGEDESNRSLVNRFIVAHGKPAVPPVDFGRTSEVASECQRLLGRIVKPWPGLRPDPGRGRHTS